MHFYATEVVGKVDQLAASLTMTQSLNFWQFDALGQHCEQIFAFQGVFVIAGKLYLLKEPDPYLFWIVSHTIYLAVWYQDAAFYLLWTGKYQLLSQPHFIFPPFITESVGVFLSALMSLFVTMSQNTKMSFSIT